MARREEMLTVLGNYKCGQLRNYWVTEDRIVMRLMLFDPGTPEDMALKSWRCSWGNGRIWLKYLERLARGEARREGYLQFWAATGGPNYSGIRGD